MKLYLAGPLFSTAEREFNAQLRNLLCAAGFEVRLPQETEPRENSAAAIFHKDVEGIDWCDVLVACMDGADPDSGTCWECGYAYGKKPVVLFRADFRTGEDPKFGPYNLMLTQSATACLYRPFRSVDELARDLIAVLKDLKSSAANHVL
jgi:nucleoside 2-deoxyribosyltransferase